MSVRKIKLPNNTTVDVNDSRIHIYRTLTGTAAVTETPFYCSRWDVTDGTITEYTDGMVVCLKVPVAGNGTYGTGFQINNLGYKPVVYNISSMVSTRYGVGSVVWAVYNSTQTASLYLNSDSATTVTGCWQVNDYGTSDTNTIGYLLRTNSSTRPVSDQTGRYRLLFSSPDNTKWIPANTSNNTKATTTKTVNQRPINPFGRIIYYSYTTVLAADATIGTGYQWDQYPLSLGYSFNRTGAALVLTYPAPVYIKCALQSDGSAIIDADTPYVQALPSTADGKIYIYLGQAYSDTNVEMTYDHPIYYHDGTQLRQYSGDATGSGNVQPDWTQNDSTADDYVKNRTHWAEETTVHSGNVITYKTSNGSNTANGVTKFWFMGLESTFDDVYGVSEWDVYGVHFLYDFVVNNFTYRGEIVGGQNGFQYTLKDSSNKIAGIFNGEISSSELASGMYQIEGTHHLDDQDNYYWVINLYLPSVDFQSITSFAINQIDEIVHKLNDKYINTPNWDAEDGEPGYIANRTHYRYMGEIWKNETSSVFSSSVQNGVMRVFCDGNHFNYLLNNTNPDGTYKSFGIEINGYEYGPYTMDTSPYDGYSTGDSTILSIYSGGTPQSSLDSDMYYIFMYYDWGGDVISCSFYFPVSEIGSTLNSFYIIWQDWIYEKLSMNYIPISGTYSGANWTNLTIGDTTKAIPAGGGGGLSDYDFTHTANTTVSTSVTVTYAADTRGSRMVSTSADLAVTFAVNNSSDNYLWVKNTGSSDIDITVSAVTYNSSSVSNVYMPSDGISVPAGGVCEIGIICNADGAFITSRGDLEL